MYTYIRIVDWTTEFRNGRTVYVVRHIIRNASGDRSIIRTYHFDTQPTREQVEAIGQAHVDNINQKIIDEQNTPKLDLAKFEEIKEQLKELVRLGVSPNQISNRLDNMISNLKADNNIE